MDLESGAKPGVEKLEPVGSHGTRLAGKELAKVVILKVVDRFVMTGVPARE